MANFDDFHRESQTVSSDTTIDSLGTVLVDTSSNAVTLTLSQNILESGGEIVIKDVGGNAGTNAITVNTAGSSSIRGTSTAPQFQITTNYGNVRLNTGGSNWV